MYTIHQYVFVCREGHQSLVQEIKTDLGGIKPDLVITVVGGGGLLIGIVQVIENGIINTTTKLV